MFLSTINMVKGRCHNIIAQTKPNISLAFRTCVIRSFSLSMRAVFWWQQDYRTSGWDPDRFNNLWLGVQCDGSLLVARCILSSDYFSRGTVLCGGVPGSLFHRHTFASSTTKVCMCIIVMSV